jgi:hypothetical protein
MTTTRYEHNLLVLLLGRLCFFVEVDLPTLRHPTILIPQTQSPVPPDSHSHAVFDLTRNRPPVKLMATYLMSDIRPSIRNISSSLCQDPLMIITIQ